MKFADAILEAIHKYSSSMKRNEVVDRAYDELKAMGFNLAIVNDRAFVLCGDDSREIGPTYWLRRNNRVDTWEVRQA